MIEVIDDIGQEWIRTNDGVRDKGYFKWWFGARGDNTYIWHLRTRLLG